MTVFEVSAPGPGLRALAGDRARAADGAPEASALPLPPTRCPSPAPVVPVSAFFPPGDAVCDALDPKLR